jgi:HK97 family phage major capsid protein
MTMSLETIRELLDTQTSLITGFDARLSDLEKKAGRPGGGSYNSGPPPAEKKALDAAFRAWIAGDPQRLDAAVAEVKAMSAGVDPDGGYFVPVESGAMLRRIAEVSPIVGMTSLVNLRAGQALEGVEDLDQFAASWVSEMAARPETAHSEVGKYRIELHEIYSMPAMSQKLLDTADIDVVAWATGKIYEAFAVAEEAAIVSGTGVGQPRGITTYPTAATADGTRAWGTFEHAATGNSGAFASSNPGDTLIDLSLKLKPQYRANASWFMSRSVAASIRKFKEATTNGYLWQPGLQQGQPDRLLGFPVVYCEALPAVGADSLSVAFGDLRAAYTTIRRPGIKLLVDPYTNKPLVNLYAYSRVGGAAVNSEALKFVKFGS